MFDRIELFERYIKPDMRVLDIGCGTGSWVERLRKQLHAKAIGIDVVNYHNYKGPFCLFDGYRLPFRDDAFDVAIFIHVLHHTDDPAKLLSECIRVTNSTIIIFEDIASSRLQNAFTRLHDFWGNKVKKFFRAIQGKHSLESIFIPMSYNYKTYGQWFTLFHNLNLKIDYMVSLPYKTMEHGIFVLSKKSTRGSY